MSSPLPVSLSTSCSRMSDLTVKRSRTEHSSSSSSMPSASGLTSLPVVLIKEIFDFLSIDQNATVMSTSRFINAVMHFKGFSHCTLTKEIPSPRDDQLVANAFKRFISENFRSIRSIDLLEASNNLNVKEIFTHPMPNLTTLNVCSEANITSVLTSFCPALTLLNFDKWTENQDLSEFRLPRLKKLDFTGWENIHREDMVSLATHSPQLEWLSLESNSENPDVERYIAYQDADNMRSDLSVLVFPKLRYLNLKGCRGITDICLMVLSVNCPLLESLSLRGHDFSIQQDSDRKSEFVFPHLKFLNIELPSRDEEDEDDLISQLDPSSFHCEQLEELTLESPVDLRCLETFVRNSPLLGTLNLILDSYREDLGDLEGLSQLSQLKHLNQLKFNSHSRGPLHFQKALEIINQTCPKLQNLDLTYFCYHESLVTLEMVKNLNFLELVDLNVKDWVQKEALDEIFLKFPKLNAASRERLMKLKQKE